MVKKKASEDMPDDIQPFFEQFNSQA